MLRHWPSEPERAGGLAQLRELDHPSLPRWLDDFVLGEGSLATLWSIHEHVAGQTLAEALAAAPEHRLEQARVIGLVRDLADALAYLHERPEPLIHAALSPMRVLLRSDGRQACLLDLGCAHPIVHGASNRGLADALAWVTPEQRFADPTPASDVWALGAIAIVALSGASLSSLRDSQQRLCWRERISVTPELAALLERMLEIDPQRRITAIELRDALDRLPSPPVRARPRARGMPQASERSADAPIMRPDELSRELSQAHHVATTLAQQQRTKLVLARVVVGLVTAVIAAVATCVALQ